MAYNQNDPNYKTNHSKIKNFNDFSDEISREKEDLKQTKRSFDKNELDVYNVANKFKKRYNKVTHKLDDVTKDDVNDRIESIEIDEIENIKENVTFTKILESIVKYTDEFRDIVSKIKSPISKKILSIENKDVKDVKSNYFSITTSNDAISFIPDKKYQDLMNTDCYIVTDPERTLSKSDNSKNVYKALGADITKTANTPTTGIIGTVKNTYYSKESKKTWALFVDKKGNEFVFNLRGLRPASSDVEKSKQEIKIGRGIKALLMSAKIESTDKEIEEFVNLYKSQWDIDNDVFKYFEVVYGEEIRKYYLFSCYEDEDKGTLGQSCMAHKNCQEYFDIYAKNKEQVGLVILHNKEDEDKISGRALLWNLDNGKKFMDRIYTTHDSDINLFKEYAEKNGWYHKKHQQQGPAGIIGPDGKDKDIDLKVTLKHVKFDDYPYMDTLKYLYEKPKVLTDKDDLTKEGPAWILEDTGGGKDCIRCDYGDMTCKKCNGDGFMDCDECKGEGNIECKKCKGNGEVTCPKCKRKKDKSQCEECHGTETVDCEECDGYGTIDCEKCGGSSRIDCDECDGCGNEQCPYCSGGH